ncbi:hypothetical protein GF373_12125 [bacterium]|nr:hypothetical protein [bacterium]
MLSALPNHKRYRLCFKTVFLFSFLLFLCVSPSTAQETVLHVDFDSTRLGQYTNTLIHRDWDNVRWTGLHDRGSIVKAPEPNHGRALKIVYPKGSVGPGEGGGQFLVSLPHAQDYWLTYDVKFSENFDFKRGGKLPGLTSGGSKYTGGNIPTKGDGWSARYMWRSEGGVMIYLYYVDMPGKWGQGLILNKVKFIPGQWHRLTQHIQVNTPGKYNGMIEVWFDGQKTLTQNNIRFRVAEKGLIDSLYFSTFHGGNSDSWAPRVDCAAFFDNFTIEKTKPKYLNKKTSKAKTDTHK